MERPPGNREALLGTLERELGFTYVRSSGPGGQNVNKVNSKAVLRWSLSDSEAFSLADHALLCQKLSRYLTVDGDLVITSDRFRDQVRNREDCLEKLAQLLAKALTVATPRKKSRPSRSSIRRVQEGKRKNSDKKRLRGRVRD